MKDFSQLRVAVIVDDNKFVSWQSESLKQCMRDGLTVSLLLSSRGARHRSFFARHLLYYVLRAISFRSKWQRQEATPASVIVEQQPFVFDPVPDGNWQLLPEDVLEEIRRHNIDVVIKFGLGLLRDPQKVSARYGILSFHHGDPSRFRGRPAGFWELMSDESTVGMIVQSISNRLDAGTVRAIGQSRVVRHSYRKTLENLYGTSSFLLKKALVSCANGHAIDVSVGGKNYRLPSNWQVLQFGSKLFGRRLRRLTYGAFREKRWEVASGKPITRLLDQSEIVLTDRQDWNYPSKFRFLADPIPVGDAIVLVEAMDRATGRGRLVAVNQDLLCSELQVAPDRHVHMAYPFAVRNEGRTLIVPEISSAFAPRAYEFDGTGLTEIGVLQGLEQERVKDPTLLKKDGLWWMFGLRSGYPDDLLWLWLAEDVMGPYRMHESSPIVVDPSRSRPAGPLFECEGRLFRPGQDCSRDYGDGVTISEVVLISPADYQEIPICRVRVEGRKGPHTLSIRENDIVFDHYVDKFALTAGLSRLRERLRR